MSFRGCHISCLAFLLVLIRGTSRVAAHTPSEIILIMWAFILWDLSSWVSIIKASPLFSSFSFDDIEMISWCYCRNGVILGRKNSTSTWSHIPQLITWEHRQLFPARAQFLFSAVWIFLGIMFFVLFLSFFLFMQVVAQNYPHILVTAGLNGKHIWFWSWYYSCFKCNSKAF